MKTETRNCARIFSWQEFACVVCDSRACEQGSVYCRECDSARALDLMRFALATNDDE